MKNEEKRICILIYDDTYEKLLLMKKKGKYKSFDQMFRELVL